MRLSRFAIACAIVGAGAMFAPSSVAVALAQKPITPPLVISSLSGRDLFQFYCSTCHGRDGKGRGPVASALKRTPADLTTIARRRAGVFPFETIERLVTGDDRPIDEHGSREMPIWGPIFRSLEPHDRLTAIRIANIVAYIESIQTADENKPALPR
jgi:mono/diheme cytochrome c family protein